MSLKIGITGHRRLENFKDVKQRISAEIRTILNSKGINCFEGYSSLAPGSDSIFAELTIDFKSVLKVVLPMPLSELLNDFATDELVVFNKLIVNDPAALIITNEIPQNKDDRNEAYLKAGQYIVDTCDILIAVWDEERSIGKGGTGDIVNYAYKIGKPVHHIKAFKTDISHLFIKNDTLAIRLKRIYQTLWKASILFSLTSAIILAISVSFKLTNYEFEIGVTELITIIIAIILILFLKLGSLNKHRIDTRRIAERLRVLERFSNCNINIEMLDPFEGLDNEIINVEAKYAAINYPKFSFKKSREHLLQFVEEQIQYHTKDRPEIKNKTFHRLEKSQFPLLISFSFGVMLHFLSICQEKSWLHFLPAIPSWCGLLLTLSIPPIYAAIEGYIFFKEYHKILIDSEKMVVFFTGIKQKLNTMAVNEDTSFETLNSFAAVIRKTMDDETKEWMFIMETKKSPGL